MDTIYRHELLAIHYDSHQDLLHVEWQGYVTSEEYRLIMKEMVKFTQSLSVKFWIFDLTQAEKVEIGDFAWTTDYLAPVLSNTSLRKIARVDGRDQNSIESIREKVENAKALLNITVEVAFFKNIAAALKWIGASEKV